MVLASKWSTSPARRSPEDHRQDRRPDRRKDRPKERRTWHRPLRTLGVLTVLALPPALGAPAWAGADDACIRDERCREHHDKAIKLYTDGYYEEALTEFQAAYEARKLPLLLINIGRTMQKLGRPKEAIAYYERFQAAESKPDPDVQKRVQKYLIEAKALLGPDGSDPSEGKPAATETKPAVPAAPPPPPPPPPGRSLIIAGGVLAGIGVVGLATGVGLWAGSQSQYNKFKGSADEFEKLAAKNSAQNLGLGSTVSYAVGAAALISGGALIGLGAKKFIEHKRNSQAAPAGGTPPAAPAATPAATPQAILVPTASGVAAVVMGEF